ATKRVTPRSCGKVRLQAGHTNRSPCGSNAARQLGQSSKANPSMDKGKVIRFLRAGPPSPVSAPAFDGHHRSFWLGFTFRNRRYQSRCVGHRKVWEELI